jgi:hypothetical protein
MRQRYTIDLERVPVQRLTLTVVAEDIVEAQDKALDHVREHPEQWVTDDDPLCDARVTKVVVHAEEVADDGGVDPEFKHLNADFMAKQKPVPDEPDWTQEDASPETVRAWMKEHAKGGDAETLARAAYEHFARPYHIGVLRQMAAEFLP